MGKPAIVKALEQVFTPKAFMNGMMLPLRELEGMVQQKGFLSAAFDTNIIIIKENGCFVSADIAK
ncbi:MAG: hypothetical protein IPO42_11245 [Chitinophagaceae bacterium]|nr:hypothetical protein [Chitinophagaceae bacterium]